MWGKQKVTGFAVFSECRWQEWKMEEGGSGIKCEAEGERCMEGVVDVTKKRKRKGRGMWDEKKTKRRNENERKHKVSKSMVWMVKHFHFEREIKVLFVI